MRPWPGNPPQRRARRCPLSLVACLALAVASMAPGCRGAGPPAAKAEDEAPAPPAPERSRERFLESCVERCTQQNQMRAIGWEVIRAECQDRCSDEWKLSGGG